MSDITVHLLPNIEGGCGCGFRIEQEGRRLRIALRSGGTEFIRTDDDVHPSHIQEFFEFALSVARAIDADREEGLVRGNFMDPRLYSEALGLEMKFDLVADRNDHTRAELVLFSGSGADSLDYCHVGVTVDVSLRQLLDDTDKATRGLPSCNP